MATLSSSASGARPSSGLALVTEGDTAGGGRENAETDQISECAHAALPWRRVAAHCCVVMFECERGRQDSAAAEADEPFRSPDLSCGWWVRVGSDLARGRPGSWFRRRADRAAHPGATRFLRSELRHQRVGALWTSRGRQTCGGKKSHHGPAPAVWDSRTCGSRSQ